MQKIVQIKDLIHKFVDTDAEGNVTGEKNAVDSVSLDVEKGEFIAILGHNGSGKSTLAKHINAILMPTSGTLYVNGKDTADGRNIWDIRQSAGMVFQNPDNQIIETVVEEDVGFGPENLGVETEEIWKRVESALGKVGMLEFRKHSPSRLSGGQKQRVAIAGVLAMHPDCIVLDEPTAMLDPHGRQEVIQTLKELNEKEKVTIILITHHMNEAALADKIFVMNEGKIALQGTPKEVFSHYDEMKNIGLDVPVSTEIAHGLKKYGWHMPDDIISEEELLDSIKKNLPEKAEKDTEHRVEQKNESKAEQDNREAQQQKDSGEVILSLRDVNYIYSADTVYRRHALKNVSLDIWKGEFIAVIGHTGSGKSTLIQHLNGLNKPSSGKILYKGQDISEKSFKLSDLRKKVGLVFQYPEYQLFETTVLLDVAFGPKNLGCDREQAEQQAREALALVGLPEECYEMSPFELSGGQKRKAAIAGVLAMNPEVLILDEPTAALDPYGRDEILSIMEDLHRKKNITILLVSHSMDEVARFAQRIIVMDKGEILMDGTPADIFRRHKELEKIGLAAPQAMYIMKELKEYGLPVDTEIFTPQEAVKEINRIRDGAEQR
ncbi:MAG: energy-coupling factor transporter ATPase [Candidatus Gastranaerophilaceae bacterium]